MGTDQGGAAVGFAQVTVHAGIQEGADAIGGYQLGFGDARFLIKVHECLEAPSVNLLGDGNDE